MNRIIYKGTAFCTGMSVMAVEMSASRLIAPYFGTSLLVWTNIIGLIMVALAGGYFMGGKVADRNPEPRVLFTITSMAGMFILIIPFVAGPIMSLAGTYSAGVFLGSLGAVILLFMVPFVLLGMISPFIIRLLTEDVDSTGATAGSVYAISTAGSIGGTYLPALVFIPLLGTARTIFLFASLLILVGAVGGWLTNGSRKLFLPVLFILVSCWFLPSQVKSRTLAGKKLFEKESLYNYLQVDEVLKPANDGSESKRARRYLVLNEGFAIHSIYDPDSVFYPLVGSVWDYFGAVVTPMAIQKSSDTNVCIVGLAAGTISKQAVELFGDKTSFHIHGVEIDPAIIDAGRTFFHMNEAELTVFAEDGRSFLSRSHCKYDLIITDAYRQPYIPFHLTTREYFELNRRKLSPKGLVAINVGSTSSESDLVRSIVATLKSVFPYVDYVPAAIGGAPFQNFVIIASMAPIPWEKLDYRLNQSLYEDLFEKRLWLEMRALISKVRKNRRSSDSIEPYVILTDDKAPVEFFTDNLILGYLASGKGSEFLSNGR